MKVRMSMRSENKILNQSGLMLVELLIVLALLGVVLALGYLYFGFGNRSYALGEQRSNTQREMRLGADYIMRELRFADQVIINPANKPAGYNFFYLNSDRSVVHRNAAGSEKVIINGPLDGIEYNLLFKREDDAMISFIITAGDNGYFLESKLIILNMKHKIDNTNGNSGAVIQYSIPSP